MGFFNWLYAVLHAAVHRSVDTTQFVIFIVLLIIEFLALFGPERLRKYARKMSVVAKTGQVTIGIFAAVVLTRLSLAPYWVWSDEHQAHISAEAKVRSFIEQGQRRLAEKYLIGVAIENGIKLNTAHKQSKEQSDADAYKRDSLVWSMTTATMIQRAYGQGEATIFAGDTGLSGSISEYPYPTEQIRLDNTHRLQFLKDLMTRSDSITLESDFNPSDYRWDCPECSNILFIERSK